MNEIKDKVHASMIENQIQEIVSTLDFKNPDSIDFNKIQDMIKETCGIYPSIVAKWDKQETLNEDLKLDKSNKFTEKIKEITITYLADGGLDEQDRPILIPVPLKFMI